MTYEKPHMTYWQILPHSWAQAVDQHACYYFYMFYMSFNPHKIQT